MRSKVDFDLTVIDRELSCRKQTPTCGDSDEGQKALDQKAVLLSNRRVLEHHLDRTREQMTDFPRYMVDLHKTVLYRGLN